MGIDQCSTRLVYSSAKQSNHQPSQQWRTTWVASNTYDNVDYIENRKSNTFNFPSTSRATYNYSKAFKDAPRPPLNMKHQISPPRSSIKKSIDSEQYPKFSSDDYEPNDSLLNIDTDYLSDSDMEIRDSSMFVLTAEKSELEKESSKIHPTNLNGSNFQPSLQSSFINTQQHANMSSHFGLQNQSQLNGLHRLSYISTDMYPYEEINCNSYQQQMESFDGNSYSNPPLSTASLTFKPKVPQENLLASRTNRGFSTPAHRKPPMNKENPRTNGVSLADLNTEEMIHHGQRLHLCFKTGISQLKLLSGRLPRQTYVKKILGKTLKCYSIHESAILDNADALQIISHSGEGVIRGGDRISLARADGSVLRLRKLSDKLGFNMKLDSKAIFIVAGVPTGTSLTNETKFYLQSEYDQSMTLGFQQKDSALRKNLKLDTGMICMYGYRNTECKAEPIQLFQYTQ